MAFTPDIMLHDGESIPQVGLGLWKVTDEAAFRQMFEAAVAAGYRHFDTAQAYGNERFLGDCLQRSELKREDVWITTKVRTETIAFGNVARSIERSLSALQTDYIDLLLLHFPAPRRKKAWKLLEAAKAAGQARSIGVSNYGIDQLQEMESYARILPAVNQIEMHVFLQQPELVRYCSEHDITIEAYSPLAHAHAMNDPVVQKIAQIHNKTYAQIMLRWCVQSGFVALPKSVTPARLQENIAIFDFELTAVDMAQLATLDRNMRTLRRNILFG